ncbi:MAG: helix-turn-helix transcriptional regulator [Clostridiales bacterium]|nr:helix-turn-helix transcriptional regulator [Clostridiales bacterium]MDU1041564.1 helix-turn-helix transcriptional regulator [Clostridiales bacterium]
MRKYSLKELRARLNLTQEILAFKLGVTTATYNNWEKSLLNVKIKYLLKISDFFKISLDEILIR